MMRSSPIDRSAGACGFFCDLTGLVCMTDGTPVAYAGALLLHLAGVGVVRRAVRRHGNRADAQLVLVAATWIPVLGPLLAWALPDPGRAENTKHAEELLEQYDRWIRFEEEPHQASPFTGDFAEDFVTFAGVESYAAVMRYGSVAQKREVLRRLVDSGKAMHMRLVRDCLLDEDPEVRLLAHAELQRMESELYDAIFRAETRAQEAPSDPAAQAAPALAHRRLASSGVLDEALSAWHAREAVRLQKQLERTGSSLVSAASERTVPRDEAAVDTEAHADPHELAMAAFRERDFAYVRRYAEQLQGEGERLPEWVRALMVPAVEHLPEEDAA